MKRKNFWLVIIAVAILCIIIPAASGAYRSLSKSSDQTAENTEQKKGALSEQESLKNDESKKSQEQPATYTVQDGDNLWLISQKFQVTVTDIKELNNLTEDELVPGQELLIPAPGIKLRNNENQETMSSRSMDASGRYVVQEGDNLWLIADNFNISVETLKEINGLNSNRVVPGQTLLVSGTAQAISRPTAPAVSNPAPAPKPKPTPAPKSKSAPVPAPKPKSNVVQTAKQYIGVPYVYGGSSPKGFDCSGFVQYVHRQHGISLPRTASGQAGVGTEVSTPAPGDLVYFTRNVGGGGIGHVGIYVGNNSFIHANIKRGVTITSLGASQWHNARYAGARRI